MRGRHSRGKRGSASAEAHSDCREREEGEADSLERRESLAPGQPEQARSGPAGPQNHVESGTAFRIASMHGSTKFLRAPETNDGVLF